MRQGSEVGRFGSEALSHFLPSLYIEREVATELTGRGGRIFVSRLLGKVAPNQSCGVAPRPFHPESPRGPGQELAQAAKPPMAL